MADINQEARIPVYINDEQAKSALKNLTGEAEKWRKKMFEAMSGGDLKGMKEAERELKKVNGQMNSIKKEAFDVNKVLQNISNSSAKDLKKALAAVNKEMEGLNRGTKEYQALANKKTALKTELSSINGPIKTQTSLLASLKNSAMELLPAFGIAAIVGGLMRAGTELFNLTKQIQGESIRSTTVLGDQFGYVANQADKMAAKMGITNREFISMVTNTADLLVPLDFTRKKAADMATQVQGLAGALDEWTAGKYGVAEVSNILTKAMLGEMEQLKGLGIAIRMDSQEYIGLVKQKQAEEGATLAQAQAMATLELIYKKSQDAQTAYTLEGNGLIRFQKAVSLGFKQWKEDIGTAWAESMKSATQLLNEQQKEVYNLEKNLVPLISQYEELSSKKLPLTSDEQQKLNGLIKQIAEITPGAITQWDNYGNAIQISADKAKEFIKAQQAMLQVKNADAIEETIDALSVTIDKYVELEEVIKRGKKLAGSQIAPYEVDLSTDELKKYAGELQNLGQKRLGLETLLKTLKGEPILPPEETGKSTNAIKSLIAVQNDLLTTAQKMPESTEAEIAAKNRAIAVIEKEISRLKELGIEKEKKLKPKSDPFAPEKEKPIDSAWIFAQVDADAIKFAEKKRSEEEWTKFLQDQIDKRTDDEAKALGIEKEIADARIALKEIQVSAIGELASSLAGMFEQGSAAQIAMIAVEKAIAIAQIWMNLAREKSNINLAAAQISTIPIVGPGLAAGYVTAMTAKAIVAAKINTGIVVAQAIGQAAGFSEGGPTGGTNKRKVAGFVHEDEYVIPEEGYNNARLRPVIDLIEIARRNGSLARLDLRPVVASISSGKQEFVSGGSTSTPAPAPSHPELVSGSPAIDSATANRLADAVEKLMEWDPAISIEMLERKQKNYNKIKNGGLK